MNLPATYRTRGDLIVTIIEEDKTTARPIYYGYFQIKDIRIRIQWDEDYNEIYGERGLDLIDRLSSPDSEPKPTEKPKKNPSR